MKTDEVDSLRTKAAMVVDEARRWGWWKARREVLGKMSRTIQRAKDVRRDNRRRFVSECIEAGTISADEVNRLDKRGPSTLAFDRAVDLYHEDEQDPGDDRARALRDVERADACLRAHVNDRDALGRVLDHIPWED